MIRELEEVKKFYSCRYDRTFKEVFLKEENEDLLVALLELTLNLKVYEIQRLNVETLQGNINTRKKYCVSNFKIVEWNMDKVLNYWYAKDEVNIQKFKYLIMLDLNEEDLAKLSCDTIFMGNNE